MWQVARSACSLRVSAAAVFALGGSLSLWGFQAPGNAAAYPKIEWHLGALLADPQEGGGGAHAGAILLAVSPGGGAQQAGLRAGDLLVECDDERVESSAEAVRRLGSKAKGATVRLAVVREASRLEFTVCLDSPEIQPFLTSRFAGPTREGPFIHNLPRGGTERLGLTVWDLTSQLAEFFGTKGGVLVANVRPWSPADRAGLRAGDVVRSVGNESIRTTADFENKLQRDLSGARLLVTVTRENRNLAVQVTVGSGY
jgi:serine protease Do